MPSVSVDRKYELLTVYSSWSRCSPPSWNRNVGDQKRLLPCAAYCDGEFGLKGMYVGVPTVIGADGIEKIVDIKLNKDEQVMFDKSIDAVKGLVDACKGIDETLA